MSVWRPHVFRGLWCRCGAVHHQEASYYVSVWENPGSYTPGRVALALGPFQEHFEALAKVETVRLEVEARWNPNGRAHWYGYGTTAMRPGYREPGKLNTVIAERQP